MVRKEDIRALIQHGSDQLALVMDEAKEDELHAVIGKVREIISHLPDSNIVLQIDFNAPVLSMAGNEYRTNLKVGLKRTCIDIFTADSDDQAEPVMRFWPVWDDDSVVFEGQSREKIRRFAQLWNVSEAE